MSTNKLFDPERSLVVVAGAGTGKTYNLVRRYLAIVATNNPDTGCPWASPQQTVAVTFTRAAAAEMRERVIEALNKARYAKEEAEFTGDEVMLSVWRTHPDYDRLIQQIDSAHIDTIHGLCASLLREFPELSLVPLDARPLDPGEESIRLERFVGRYIDGVLDGPETEERRDLVSLLVEVPLNNLKSELRALIGENEEIPEEWASSDHIAQARSAFVERQWRKMEAEVLPKVTALNQLIQERLADKNTENQTALLQTRQLALSELLCAKERRAKIEAYEAVQSLKKSENLGTKNVEVMSRLEEIKVVLQTSMKVRGKDVKPLPDEDTIHAGRIARWVRIGRQAREAYRKQLRTQSLVRFNDLEERAICLLQQPEAKKTLRGRFTHILVDEFQDTNEQQVNIIEGLKAACGEVVSFYVGDPKQSIYRFRGADVSVFQREIGKVGPEAREELPKTFRTSPALGAFFNQFFPRLLDPTRYDQDDDLAPVPWTTEIECNRTENAIESPPIDLLLRVKGKSNEGEEEDRDDDSSEALRLAAHLRALLERNYQIFDKKEGQQRHLRPKDFAILLPKWSLAEDFRAALETYQVPAELAGGRGLFQLPEVRDLINLIRFWANWEDNLAAAGVLRGPCFGLSDLGLYVLSRWPGVEKWDKNGAKWLAWPEKLPERIPFDYPRSLREAALRAHIVPEVVVEALLKAVVLDPAREEETTRQLIADAASLCTLDGEGRPTASSGIMRMNGLTEKAGVLPTADLLADAIVSFRMEAAWIKSRSGRRAVANAWRFVEMVRRVEAEGPNLADLVSWLDSGSDPTPEGLISGESDAVTITTLHGSKGLEWPVVALAGIGSGTGGFGGASWASEAVPNLDGCEPQRVPRIRVPQGGFLYDSDPLDKACSILQSPAEAAEVKRQLYVALTRAKDRLILSGELSKNVGHNGKGENRKPFPLSQCSSHNNYLGALLGLTSDDPDQADTAFRPSEEWAAHFHVVKDDELAKMPTCRSVEQIGAPDLDPTVLNWGMVRNSIRIVSPSLAENEPAIAELPFEAFEPIPSPVELPDSDARLMGVLFHAVMEEWNFVGATPDANRLLRLAEGFFPGDGLNHVGWLNTCIEKIDQSLLGVELKAAAVRGELFHEVNIDALLPTKAETLRAKGRMDLLFKDAQGLWCVVDYKETVKVRTVEELAGVAYAYGRQLALYRSVVETWRPGQVGRVGLWLAPAGKVWWVENAYTMNLPQPTVRHHGFA